MVSIYSDLCIHRVPHYFVEMVLGLLVEHLRVCNNNVLGSRPAHGIETVTTCFNPVFLYAHLIVKCETIVSNGILEILKVHPHQQNKHTFRMDTFTFLLWNIKFLRTWYLCKLINRRVMYLHRPRLYKVIVSYWTLCGLNIDFSK